MSFIFSAGIFLSFFFRFLDRRFTLWLKPNGFVHILWSGPDQSEIPSQKGNVSQ